MTSVLEPPTATESGADFVLLRNISWSTYESLLKDQTDTPNPRLTYDRGVSISGTKPLVRGKKRLDLSIDPPPDLVVEIDISRSSLNRFPLFAAFEVPEIWRFDGLKMQVSCT